MENKKTGAAGKFKLSYNNSDPAQLTLWTRAIQEHVGQELGSISRIFLDNKYPEPKTVIRDEFIVYSNDNDPSGVKRESRSIKLRAKAKEESTLEDNKSRLFHTITSWLSTESMIQVERHVVELCTGPVLNFTSVSVSLPRIISEEWKRNVRQPLPYRPPRQARA
jgi:hypothetical protein